MDVLSVTFLASCESERERNLHRAVMELFLRQSLQTSGLCLTVSWTDNTSQLRSSAGSAHCQSQRQLCIPTSAEDRDILRQNIFCVYYEGLCGDKQTILFQRCICSYTKCCSHIKLFLLFPLRFFFNVYLNLFS